ncbi:MAG: CPBP family intramembrane metalloprotease [Caldilineaceae bacterium]|nr:CPBP family intramembrane metalloprotease [Caldilineaceae bacterium]
MSELLSMLLLFAPLIFLVWLANLAEARREQQEPYQGLAVTTYVLLGLFYGLMIVVGLALQFFTLLIEQRPELLQEFTNALGTANPLLQVDSFSLLGLGLWLPSLFGILLLLPPVRRLLARFTPIDADSPVHAIALGLSVLVVVQLLFTLGWGLTNLAEALSAQEAAGVTTNTMLSLWVQQLMTAVFAFFGVGWLARRSWSATLQRLGLVVPSWGNVLLGSGLGLGMVPVVMLIEWASGQLSIGVDPGVEKLTEQLLGPLFTTPFGIITLGLSAALGEETLFRGAVQPRFGYLLTALLFALVHSNYGISLSTLIVFILGLLLGVVRMRTNTTTAMIFHAVYNMSLGLLAFWGV